MEQMMQMMRRMMELNNRCTEKAQRLWEFLRTLNVLRNRGIQLPVVMPEHFSFRVSLPGPLVGRLSISVPPDANEHCGEPSIFEIALIGDDERVIYNDLLGYNDVNRFETVDELVAEMIRLSGDEGNDDESDDEEDNDSLAAEQEAQIAKREALAVEQEAL